MNRKPLCAWLLLLGLTLVAGEALAEPYFAQREGYKCSKCHVNRTGGGKRTEFGYQYGLTHLAMFETGEGGLFGHVIDPAIGRGISVGANYRLTHTTAFAKEIANSFQNHEANLYADFSLADFARLYTDVSVAEGSVEAREAFGMLTYGEGLHLKGGLLLLPYGLRIWGDDEFIRQVSGVNYASPDLGVELGVEHGPLSVYAAVTNGAGGGVDSDNAKRVAALAEVSFSAVRSAVSFSYNSAESRTSYLAGSYLGVALGRVTLLAEVDVVTTHFEEPDSTVLALLAYGEVNLLVMRGLSLFASYGYHDPALDVQQDQRMAVRGGLSFFPLPFVAGTLSYELRASVPRDEVGNADLLLAELHLYF